VVAYSAGPGYGSEFVVRLPALTDVAVAGAAEAPPAEARADGAGLRVLVVDDNEDAADTLAEALTLLGHSVEIAHDGPEALEKLQVFGPDIALLDIGLPVMDGYELARRIRGQAGLSNVRLIAVTGYGQPKDRQRAAVAGFDAHLVKPVDLTALENAIAGYVPHAN
jgi:CheY-like chemotaxis protein